MNPCTQAQLSQQVSELSGSGTPWPSDLQLPDTPLQTLKYNSGFLALACTIALANVGRGQQNLFNVPSGVITAPGDLFFQEQLNLAHRSGNCGTTFDYGLGNGWEAGLNVVGLKLYDRFSQPSEIEAAASGSDSPDFMLNVQKGFEVTRWWRSSVGTQIGTELNFSSASDRLLSFSWTTNALSVPSHPEFGTWFVGGYYANSELSGGGPAANFLLGAEIPVWGHNLAFQADAVLGSNDLGLIVIGGVYTFENRWQISLGAQIPTENSGNPFGVVVEFTYPGAAP